ncbi:MAG: glycosyltransferase family 2 protein [Ilumatobacter sp.]
MGAAHLAGTLASGAAVVATLPSLHTGVLTAASLTAHACGTDDSTRFAVLVPAHDEATNIEATLASLAELTHSPISVVVIADNCTDNTAEEARRCGVRVLERTDPDRRGKGPALHWAIPRVLADPDVDAIVIVDADTVVEPSLLGRLSWHFAHGADAVQADYRVRNPEASWRTRLLDVGFTAQHRVRSGGRSALGMSAGLHGNGMAFSRATLEAVPYTAFSVVEDIEYALLLGRSDRRVVACVAAHVAGDMPTTREDAGAQRTRWEAGRTSVTRRHRRAFVRRALRRRDIVAFGHAADLISPPLTTTVAALAASTAVAAVMPSRSLSTAVALAWAGMIGHVGTSVRRSADPRASLRALARVPRYALWKLRLASTKNWSEQRAGLGAWERSVRSDTANRHLRLIPTDQLEGAC